jgi:hypothetical protein
MDNRNGVDRMEDNYDRLWTIWDVFEILNRTFSKFYNPSENLAFDNLCCSDTIFPRNTSILTSKFTNSTTQAVTHMTQSTWGRTETHDTAFDSHSCQSD